MAGGGPSGAGREIMREARAEASGGDRPAARDGDAAAPDRSGGKAGPRAASDRCPPRTAGPGASSSRDPDRVTAPPDWPVLRAAARDAAGSAYAPYSGLPVGAAALCDDGRVVTGCNVENASYGLGVCAEVTLVGQLRLTGGGRLVALACRSGDGALLMPCGRCRQVIHEFGGADCLVDTPRGPRPMSDVLPDAFGPEDLP